MKRLVLFIFCLIYTPLYENVPVSDEFSESSESSLTFTWTSPLQLQVRNNHGEMDKIQLRPTNSIGSFPLDCLFDGYLLNDEEGSVAVSGCQDWTEVTIVIMSRYSRGSMFTFASENNMTQEVRIPPSFFGDYGIRELDEDMDMDNKMRSKRSYQPFDEYEMYDEMSHGAADMPEALVFSFRIAYEKSFLTKMQGSRTDAENYINRVIHLSKKYFTEKSLGVEIYLNIKKEIAYLQDKTFTPAKSFKNQGLYDLNFNEPLSIFVFTDDSDVDRGKSNRKGACCNGEGGKKTACKKQGVFGRLLNKWRYDIKKAVLTHVHELGHWFAMYHDALEDKYNKKAFNNNEPHMMTSTSIADCHNTGLMTNLADPPKVWSECSRGRFVMFYGNYKDNCPFLNPVWSQWSSWSTCSRTCGSGTQSRRRTCSGGVCLDSSYETRTCNRNSCPVVCGSGATRMSIAPGHDMVLCKDEKKLTCEKDFESLCPTGWNLCHPKQFNNRNSDWDYNWMDANAGSPMGVIYCKTRLRRDQIWARRGRGHIGARRGRGQIGGRRGRGRVLSSLPIPLYTSLNLRYTDIHRNGCRRPERRDKYQVEADRAYHYTIDTIHFNNPVLNMKKSLNCWETSGRRGCEFYAGKSDCDGKEKSALCCAPTNTCGDGRVQDEEEDCDDGNLCNEDDCLNTCTWRNPGKHGLSGC